MSGRIETYDSRKEPTSKWSQNEAFSVREAGVDIGKSGGQGGSNVSVDQVVTSGREVAGVTVDGERTPILIPNAGEWTQSDWAEADPSDDAYIKNKPSLAQVATSGDYGDLDNTPDLSNFVEDSNYVHTDNNYDAGAKNIVDHVTDNLANKVDKVSGKVLSDNNFTNAQKDKLTNLSDIYGVGANLTLDPETNILSANAQPITIDDEMSSSSTNPVQNRVITSALGDKVDKVTGKVLSDNNFSNADKQKLDGIDQGAEVNDISTISVNGTNVPADANKNVNLQISSGEVIFGTTDPTSNIGSDDDRYVKVSTTDFGKSFRIHTSSTSSYGASINIDTIENGAVVSTDEIVYTNPSRTYSDFTVVYSGQWIVTITTDNVYGYETGDTINWQFYEEKDVTLVIDPPEVYAEYLKSSGIWVKLYDNESDLTNYYTKTETNGLLADKVDKVQGKGLSTEDYTTAEKTKLASLSTYSAGDGIDISNGVISTDNLQSGDMSDIVSPLPGVVSNRVKYSTDEQVIGEWIDGKPLYQKTIDCGALPVNSTKNVGANLPSGTTIIRVDGIAVYPNNYILPLPYVAIATGSPTDSDIIKRMVGVHYDGINDNIVIRTYTDRSAFTNTYITIQYTKSTD